MSKHAPEFVPKNADFSAKGGGSEDGMFFAKRKQVTNGMFHDGAGATASTAGLAGDASEAEELHHPLVLTDMAKRAGYATLAKVSGLPVPMRAPVAAGVAGAALGGLAGFRVGREDPEQLRERMQAAEAALLEHELGQAAAHGRQALGHLGRAGADAAYAARDAIDKAAGDQGGLIRPGGKHNKAGYGYGPASGVYFAEDGAPGPRSIISGIPKGAPEPVPQSKNTKLPVHQETSPKIVKESSDPYAELEKTASFLSLPTKAGVGKAVLRGLGYGGLGVGALGAASAGAEPMVDLGSPSESRSTPSRAPEGPPGGKFTKTPEGEHPIRAARERRQQREWRTAMRDDLAAVSERGRADEPYRSFLGVPMPGVRVKPGDLRPSIGFPTKGEMAASRSAKDALRDASRRGQSDGPFSIMSEEGASGVAGRLLGTAQGEWERLLTNRENRTKRDAEAEFLSALKGERDKAQSRYGGMQDRRFEGEPAVAQAGGTTPVNRADAPDTGTTPVDWADAPDTGTTPVDWADAPAADQASRPEASRRAGGRAATKAQDRSRPEANIGEKRPTDELALAETRWGDQIDDEFPDADPETRRELLRLVMGQGGLPREMLMSPAPLVSGRAPGAGPTQIAGK